MKPKARTALLAMIDEGFANAIRSERASCERTGKGYMFPRIEAELLALKAVAIDSVQEVGTIRELLAKACADDGNMKCELGLSQQRYMTRHRSVLISDALCCLSTVAHLPPTADIGWSVSRQFLPSARAETAHP